MAELGTEPPLTEEEQLTLRRLLPELEKIVEEEKHVRWFWANLRVYASWTMAAVIGIAALQEKIRAFVSWLFR